MTRYFYDTEFIEDGETIKLISIGIVCEDGDEYYAVNADAPWMRIERHPWLKANVVPHLPMSNDAKTRRGGSAGPDKNHPSVKPLWVIRNEILDFLTCGDEIAELWADYGAYDHVVLAQLWGPMAKLPKPLPMYTNDIQTFANLFGVDPDELPQSEQAHNALDDAHNVAARWLEMCFKGGEKINAEAAYRRKNNFPGIPKVDDLEPAEDCTACEGSGECEGPHSCGYDHDCSVCGGEGAQPRDDEDSDEEPV